MAIKAEDFERYFSWSQEELEARNRELMQAVADVRAEQAILHRALDNRVAEARARALVDDLAEPVRIALKEVLR